MPRKPMSKTTSHSTNRPILRISLLSGSGDRAARWRPRPRSKRLSGDARAPRRARLSDGDEDRRALAAAGRDGAGGASGSGSASSPTKMRGRGGPRILGRRVVYGSACSSHYPLIEIPPA